MTLKKRMFRSNMAILLAALLTLLCIIVAVLILFEDSLENELNTISETKVEAHAADDMQIMGQEQIQTAEELQKEVDQWGYEAAMAMDGRIVSGQDTDEMHDLAEIFQTESYVDSQTGVFTFRKATVVGKYLEESGGYLVAVHFPETDWLTSSLNPSFYAFILTVLAAGFAGILFLLFLASFFTKRMNRAVMEPVELLEEGAKRVRDGNLEEDIKYHGEEEFEHVCGTFNDMQHTILEDRRQRAKMEQARTDMVTGISHDLRTPLTSIRGYIMEQHGGTAVAENAGGLKIVLAFPKDNTKTVKADTFEE